MTVSQRSVLITGTSSGIGHAAAELFAAQGWRVLAGSRHPEKLTFGHPSILPVGIDVNDPQSIGRFFAGLQTASLDCVVNNAGYGLVLPFEDTSMEQVESMFRTNVFGLMAVSRHAVKLFRERGSGTLVNVSSVIGRIGMPWYTVYCSTKWAVEGFSESLAREVRPFNVRVKIVEPAGTATDFYRQAYGPEPLPVTEAYRAPYEAKWSARAGRKSSNYDTSESVASLVYAAATDGSWQLRYPMPRAMEMIAVRQEEDVTRGDPP